MTALIIATVAALVAAAWFAAIARVRKEQRNEWEHRFWMMQSEYETLKTKQQNGKPRKDTKAA